MIIFSRVNKQFLPDSYALQDISFEIQPGEFIVLTGPSGSGKTTLMKLLTKEYTPSSGEIVFHNTKLSDIPSSKIHEHRRKIGVVFQDYKLIGELNIWENIALPLSIIGKSEQEIERRVTDLLELVSLTHKAFHFPEQLSGGEAQRISIARALSTAPAIIFADEPTGNLDKENSLQIAKLLTKINQLGTTVLFATHDHDVIDLLSPNRHITIDNGMLTHDSKAASTKSSKTKEKPETQVKEQELPHKEKEEPKEKNPKKKKTEEKEPKDKTETPVKKQKSQENEKETSEKKVGFWSTLFGKKKQES